jgi:hypothetical protein
MQEIFGHPPIRHVEHWNPRIARLGVAGRQIDIDAPRFAQNPGVNRKGVANDKRRRLLLGIGLKTDLGDE